VVIGQRLTQEPTDSLPQLGEIEGGAPVLPPPAPRHEGQRPAQP
jgi:hypothetical protein